MKLVLVGGTGRSGTSFVYRQILQNDEVHGYPNYESGMFTINMSLIDVYDRYIESYSPDRFCYVCSVFKQAVIANSPPSMSKEELTEHLDRFISGLYKDRLTRLPLLTCFQDRARNFFEDIFRFDPGKNRVLLEKTPHNILLFKIINRIFPEAKIIHIIRDPRSVAESIVRQTWGPKDYRNAVIWVRLILGSWINQYRHKEFDRERCMCIRVEDLITKYEHKEVLVRNFMNERLEDLSLRADPDTLDGWRENISDEDYEFACDKLRDILEYFSYKPEIISSMQHSTESDLDYL